MTEQLPYEVIQTFRDFEIRKYSDYVLVQYIGEGDSGSISSIGFGSLFRFITGNNDSEQKISMTAPVMQETPKGKSHTVSFVMPKDLQMKDVPNPNDPKLIKTNVAEHFAAVMRFSGTWNDDRVQAKSEQLKQALDREGIKTVGDFFFARFDPPWKPGFLRHNEVLIRIEMTPDEIN